MGEVDNNLVQAARRGDADAWNGLFQACQLPLYAFVIKMVRNESTALDIVQETFIAATRHLGSLREDGRFLSWMFSIARQKCTAHWRRTRNEPDPTAEANDPEALDETRPGDLLLAAEQQQLLHEHLARLPEPHREVVVLFFLEEFSLEEIAEITESKIGTVKSRLHYAKKTLRRQLEKENEITQRNPVGASR